MFSGDVDRFEDLLSAFAESIFSFYDQARSGSEAVPHGFLLGLCAVLLPTHRVVSERESGGGRPDVLIIPRKAGEPGVVMELKVVRRKKKTTLEQALEDGIKQLREKDYAAELREAGAHPIVAYAIAFEGKEVLVAKV